MTGASDRNGGVDSTALDLLRRAGVEMRDLGERLSRYEFSALRAELQSDDPFALTIGFDAPRPSDQGADPDLALSADAFADLPPLPVPLGRIAWSQSPETLPANGVLIEDEPDKEIARALLSLLGEHHRLPFARLVFICRTLRPIHVLGRYGLICHFDPVSAVPDVGGWLNARYGISDIRKLQDGKVIWSAPKG